MSKKVLISESELHDIIFEAVNNYMLNEETEEGWFGDKVNQVKSAGSTMFGAGNGNLKQRWNNTRKNWTSQGDLNGLNGVLQTLTDYIDAGQLDPQMTIAQLVGGKYNNNKMGRLTGQINNRKSQISRRGGNSYEEE